MDDKWLSARSHLNSVSAGNGAGRSWSPYRANEGVRCQSDVPNVKTNGSTSRSKIGVVRSACQLATLLGRSGHILHQEVLQSLAVSLFPFQAFRYPIAHAVSALYLGTSLLFWFHLDHRETRRGAAGGDRPQDERGNPGQVAFQQVESHSTLARSNTTSRLQRYNFAADNRAPDHKSWRLSARPHNEAGSSAVALF